MPAASTGLSIGARSFKRANRILPPFVACLALTLLLWFVAPSFFASGSHEFVTPTDRSGYSIEGFWQTGIFVNGLIGPTLSANGPLWSLTFEVWYYALTCLFALGVSDRRYLWMAGALLLGLSALRIWFLIFGLVWLGGFLVSVLHANNRLPKLLRLSAWLAPLALLVAIPLVPASWTGKTALLFQLVFGAWMVWHIIHVLQREHVSIFRPLVWSESFSYTLYVTHFPILLFAYGVNERAGMAAVAVTLMFCALVGLRLERLAPFKQVSPAVRRA